jgi:hypothetical protein
MYAYVDETGNTGARILDDAQPLFITAALLTRSNFDQRFGADVRAIAQSCDLDAIHAAELGVARLEQIAPAILKVLRKAGPAFALARVEKRYVVAAKVFDTIFDCFENKAVPWHIYNIPVMRITMVFKIAHILDEDLAAEFIDALLDTNTDRARAKMAAFCAALRPSVEGIPDQRSRDVIGEGLDWVVANPESLDFVHSSKVGRKGHLPNMVGFGNLLSGIEHQSAVWRRPVDCITHDRQQEFAAALKFWHEMFSNARADLVDIPFSGKMVLRKVFGSRLEMSSSHDSAGIQIIDVILWLFARAQKEDLPPNCQRILDYVYSRGHLDDFSFANAEEAAGAVLDQAYAADLSPQMLDEARSLNAEIEQRRLSAMDDYAREKEGAA